MKADDLFGTWRLRSWKNVGSDGSEVYPLGERPVGYIFYNHDGYMSVEIMAEGRVPYQEPDVFGGTPQERSEAIRTYISYAGSFEVLPDRDTVIHHIEVCSYPNWIGNAEERRMLSEWSSASRSTPVACPWLSRSCVRPGRSHSVSHFVRSSLTFSLRRLRLPAQGLSAHGHIVHACIASWSRSWPLVGAAAKLFSQITAVAISALCFALLRLSRAVTSIAPVTVPASTCRDPRSHLSRNSELDNLMFYFPDRATYGRDQLAHGGRHAGPSRRPAGSARRRLSLGRGARRRVKRTSVQMAGTAGSCKVLAATL